MRKFPVTIFALLVFVKGLSQNVVPETFEIKTDTIFFQLIDSLHLLVLEDKSNTIQFKDALALYQNGKFAYSSPGTDSNVHTHWFVYRLHNAMNRPARIALNSMSDYDNFYVFEDSVKPTEYFSGLKADKDIKSGLKVVNFIPVELQQDKSLLVFQRVENTGKGLPEEFGVYILSTDAAIKEYYTNYVDRNESYFNARNLQEAFIVGMVLIIVLLNLFFYRIVKESLYMYFALFAFFLGINRFYGITDHYFTFEYTGLRAYVDYIGFAWIFILFFLARFFQAFLDLKKQFPKLNLLLNILLFIYVTFYLSRLAARFFPTALPRWTWSLPATCGFLLIPLLLIVVQILCIGKSKPNRYLFGGSVLFLLLLFISHIVTPDGLNLFPGSILSRILIENFRLFEAIFLALLIASFTWILLMRFIELRRLNAQQALEKERLEKEIEIEKNELIEQQKIQLEKDVAERTQELKISLDELKATQKQLIQSEKMASLGELTAGIAHEIQNPLNFVNNFSDVNTELIGELKEELAAGNLQLATEIADDIQQNEAKINHHGKRADGIVKGMLQHSRSNTGEKEATDINKLADEYLRLSYHGMRSKDNNFNVDMKTVFDETIGFINAVPQDIGRVLLNLYNNAFYAVNEKAKQQAAGYKPEVGVTTKKTDGRIEISVTDNGNGIPQGIVDKIFQPFFTTKPTGSGTGLGLSLSYDIVKAHGGELKVNSKEGEGSEFIVVLLA